MRVRDVSVEVHASDGVRVTVRVTSPPGQSSLKFGQGNAKLSPAVTTFSLPAGWACPFARDCRSRADPATGRVTDGKRVRYRCYAASMEARRPSVRRARWHNLRTLKACGSTSGMTRLILDSLSPFARLVRVHDSGDFYSQAYFDAWLEVARERPETIVYAYTKAVPFWGARVDEVGNGHTPGRVPNLVLTASRGGSHDDTIDRLGLRSARVLFSPGEAADLGLSVDHDDSHAMGHGPDFGLLLHGSQPAGTDAARAMSDLRAAGFGGYGRSTRLPLALVGPAGV